MLLNFRIYNDNNVVTFVDFLQEELNSSFTIVLYNLQLRIWGVFSTVTAYVILVRHFYCFSSYTATSLGTAVQQVRRSFPGLVDTVQIIS